MDRKTNTFFLILAIVTFVSIILIYNRAFITKDYEIIGDNSELSQD